MHAVDGVDLDVYPGEVIGIVGESGCGKSTLGRIIAGINPPTAGEISYMGKKISAMETAERRAYELSVQMIFQNPMASLNRRARSRAESRRSACGTWHCSKAQKKEYVATDGAGWPGP